MKEGVILMQKAYYWSAPLLARSRTPIELLRVCACVKMRVSV